MLTTSQRERILSHIQNGWKLPDSLILELWEAYEALEQTHTSGLSAGQGARREANSGQVGRTTAHEQRTA